MSQPPAQTGPQSSRSTERGTPQPGAGKALALALLLGALGMSGMLGGFWMLMEPPNPPAETTAAPAPTAGASDGGTAKAADTAEASKNQGPVLWPGLGFVLAGLVLDVAGAAVLLRHAGRRS